MNYLRYTLFLGLLLNTPMQAQSPRRVEVGLQGGGTFTSGYLNVPANSFVVYGASLPAFSTRSDGIGVGYVVGAFARLNKLNNKGFVQAEVRYGTTALPQRTQLALDVTDNPLIRLLLGNTPNTGPATAQLNATANATLTTIDVPVLVGRRILNERVRIYAGPSLILLQKANANFVAEGQIVLQNASPINVPATALPLDLTNPAEAAGLELKRVTWGLDGGVGFSPLPWLELDLRYSVPAGGYFRSSRATGFLGTAAITVGLKWPQ
jgi:hypothetical protein